MAHDALMSAENLIKKAEKAINKKKINVAEIFYRKSLAKIREALLLEPHENAHSKYLHSIGRLIHNTFGCKLEFKDGQYWVSCPVLLSHNKMGFSIGGSGKAICSICGVNILDCSHVKGNNYDGIIATKRHNLCNICGQEKCDHKEGETYDDVMAFGIIVKLELDHVSMVSNPANPLCAIYGYSIPESDLFKRLPDNEKDQYIHGGTIIYCHHCEKCEGL